MTATPGPRPGSLGNLTPSQEAKLREFWNILLQSWDKNDTNPDGATKSPTASANSAKPQRRFFSLSRSQPQTTDDELFAIPSKMLASLKSLNAGFPKLRVIQSLLTKLHGDKLRAAYVNNLKQDHPDALLLRFLRAEKWDVPNAWIKIVKALNWRVNEFHVDEEVLRKGEEYALDKSRNGEGVERNDGEGFTVQLRTGKGHIHGADRLGRPIVVVRARLHNPGGQTARALNNYIVHCIETLRVTMVPPVETVTVMFDLTSFSLSNWDFPPIKFIIENFQEHYPESLGALVFYNAPWVFSGLWKLIHAILDPVVAAKVHFLSGAQALEKLIPQDRIIKELGGAEDWEYEYIEPKPHENDKLHDTATRDTILADRKKLADELFSLTTEWISGSEVDESLNSSRDAVIKKLSDNYWTLDPYVRARTILDRTGVIKGDGEIDFYPDGDSQSQSGQGEKSALEHVNDRQFVEVAV